MHELISFLLLPYFFLIYNLFKLFFFFSNVITNIFLIIFFSINEYYGSNYYITHIFLNFGLKVNKILGDYKHFFYFSSIDFAVSWFYFIFVIIFFDTYLNPFILKKIVRSMNELQKK